MLGWSNLKIGKSSSRFFEDNAILITSFNFYFFSSFFIFQVIWTLFTYFLTWVPQARLLETESLISQISDFIHALQDCWLLYRHVMWIFVAGMVLSLKVKHLTVTFLNQNEPKSISKFHTWEDGQYAFFPSYSFSFFFFFFCSFLEGIDSVSLKDIKHF